jgi:phosphoribosylaminoimidazolecarboxamide formyltransferase/IMP cyclohydrolase
MLLDPNAPTAFISVSEKSGLTELASTLTGQFGYQLLATGGTFSHLQEAGLNAIESTELTGFGELAGGRVKSLHPSIYAGILSKRDELETGDEPLPVTIDAVIVNLYPFEDTLKQGGSDGELIEKIDIGGPSLLRAAAKNHAFVNVLSNPDQYDSFIAELASNEGESTLAYRKNLAKAAFALTHWYDAAISQWFGNSPLSSSSASATQARSTQPDIETLPDQLAINLTKLTDLRYGENPHQQAALYTQAAHEDFGFVQLHGKALSYNNLVDMMSAWNIAAEFNPETDGAVCAVIKHNNPCGVAKGHSVADAWHHAFFADSLSAFGGVVAFNQPVDGETAEQMKDIFLEVIIAPEFSADAREILASKKNLRLIARPWTEGNQPPMVITALDNSRVLIQRDTPNTPIAIDQLMNEGHVSTVTNTKPTATQLDDMRFAWKVVKHVKSNAIVLAKDGRTVGMGIGQTSRIGALEIALRQACDEAKDAVMASDGFLPAVDNVQAAVQARVGAIIQPGGSIKDKDVVELANTHNLAMVTTGIREFRH